MNMFTRPGVAGDEYINTNTDTRTLRLIGSNTPIGWLSGNWHNALDTTRAHKWSVGYYFIAVLRFGCFI